MGIDDDTKLEAWVGGEWCDEMLRKGGGDRGQVWQKIGKGAGGCLLWKGTEWEGLASKGLKETTKTNFALKIQ